MARFITKCPHCGTINSLKDSIFSKKVVPCGTCGKDIDVKSARLASKICPHCNESFVYDQAKGLVTNCPSCGKTINNLVQQKDKKVKYITLNCSQCACPIELDDSLKTYECPICHKVMNVEQERLKAQLVTSGGVSVIQYEGDNSVFVWKHPIEDFNMGSQLLVHESQEAIFFMNGQALDLFGPGRHTLETENLPILKQLYKVPTGSQTPFHAEVYFINKTVSMGMKWGTDSRVRFVDPATGIPLDIGASGEMNLQVSDARKLLVKLVGTTGGLTNKEVLSNISGPTGTVHRTLQSYFRAPLMTEVKSYLASTIKQQQLDIMSIDENMAQLSEALRERISPKFEEYGLTIPQFYITYISLPEDDPNFKKLRDMRSAAYLGVWQMEIETSIAEAQQKRDILKAQTAAQLEAIKAQGAAEATRLQGMAEAQVMQAKGYTQKDVLEADVQKAYAAGLGQMGSGGGNGGNGGGGMVSEFVTMGAGMRMAETVFDKMNFGATKSEETSQKAAPAENTWKCVACGAENTGKFCMDCGKPKPESWDCACGHKGNRGKFCEECGTPRPTSWDCACGQKGNTGKCCPECGARRPE